MELETLDSREEEKKNGDVNMTSGKKKRREGGWVKESGIGKVGWRKDKI